MQNYNFSDLVQFLDQGASQANFVAQEYDNGAKSFFVLSKDGSHPEDWPEGVPDLVRLQYFDETSTKQETSVFVYGDDGLPYVIVHDPENEGGFALMKAEDALNMYYEVIEPFYEQNQSAPAVVAPGLYDIQGGEYDGQTLRMAVLGDEGQITRFGDIKLGESADVVFVDPSLEIGDVPASTVGKYDVEYRVHDPVSQLDVQMTAYESSLAPLAAPTFGRDISVADMGKIGRVIEFNPSSPEPVSAPLAQVDDDEIVVSRRREAPAVAVQPEPEPEPDVFEAPDSAQYMATLGEDMPANAEMTARTTFIQMERYIAQGRMDIVERYFDPENSGAVDESWRAVVADYLEERLAAGEPIGFDRHLDAVRALQAGDVDAARAHMDGREQVVEKVVEQDVAVVEDAPKAAPLTVEQGEPPVSQIEPAGGGEVSLSRVEQVQVEMALKSGVISYDAVKDISAADAQAQIYYALERADQILAVDANFAGVISGDYADLSTIEIHLDQLPQEYEFIRDELAAVQDRISSAAANADVQTKFDAISPN